MMDIDIEVEGLEYRRCGQCRRNLGDALRMRCRNDLCALIVCRWCNHLVVHVGPGDCGCQPWTQQRPSPVKRLLAWWSTPSGSRTAFYVIAILFFWIDLGVALVTGTTLAWGVLAWHCLLCIGLAVAVNLSLRHHRKRLAGSAPTEPGPRPH